MKNKPETPRQGLVSNTIHQKTTNKPGFLGEMAESRTVAGNIQDEPGTPYYFQKVMKYSRKCKKENIHTQWCGTSKGHKNQMKELPMA